MANESADGRPDIRPRRHRHPSLLSLRGRAAASEGHAASLRPQAFIPSRSLLEDHATVLMHYDNGARGRLWVSSVDAGSMGALHAEGLGDSWSNIYLWIAQAIDAAGRGDVAFLKTHHYSGIAAGTEGVRRLEACVRSADAGATWVDFA